MSFDERLSRLIRKLSAEHDFQSSSDEAPHMRFLSSVPLHWAPEICTFPGLSIVPPPLPYQQSYHGQRQQHRHQQEPPFIQPYEQLDPALKPDQSQHQEYIHLMSRKEQCSQYSIPLASFNMLRSLMLTFRRMLKYQIQHLIFKVMESKHRSILNNSSNNNSSKNNHDAGKREEDRKLLEKFANLSTSSLVCPESIRTFFSTMLPMEQWQEVGYENICLRLVFRAEILLRIVPDDTIHKATLTSSGVTVGAFPTQMNNRRPEELDIDINTKRLYYSIRRECKVIAKKVVNAIAGYELLKPKPKHHSSNMVHQRHPSMMVYHHKHISMNSDGATLKTEKTTLSSLDERDPRLAASMHIEECGASRRDIIPTPSSKDHQFSSALLHEAGCFDLTPKKKTSITKVEYHGKQYKQNSLSANALGGKTNETQEVDKTRSNFVPIHEQQEALDGVEMKKLKKKKERGWKRLLSPHKAHKNESFPKNKFAMNEIDTSKKYEGLWKGVRFTSSKQ